MTAAELAIREAMAAVEGAGASVAAARKRVVETPDRCGLRTTHGDRASSPPSTTGFPARWIRGEVAR